MSKNQGKIFEEDWKKSMPNYALLYRIPDPAQSFGGSNNLRFSRKPDFDFILWDSQRHILYALELKTVGGKSISFERSDKDHGEIHANQINGLNKWNAYDGIVCGVIVNFRGIKKTVFIDISEINKIINITPKKSFNFDDLEKHQIKYTTISQWKLKTRYRYDADGFLRGQLNITERGN